MIKISKRMKKLFSTNSKLVLLIVVAFLLVMGIIRTITSGTLSKYTNKSYYSHNVNSGKFIFNSDSLAEEEQINIKYNYNYEGIPFKIKNYNVTEYTHTNITYDLTCTTNIGTCTLSENSGTLSSNELNENSHTFTISNPSNLEGPIIVVVTATSTSPYTKTLTGRYILYTNNDVENGYGKVLVYENELYCEYLVTNNSSYPQNFSIMFQDTQGYVTFDENCELYQNKYFSSISGHLINRIRTGILPYSSQVLRFYKSTSSATCAGIVETFSATPCSSPYARGDVDNDGYVTANDALDALQAPKGLDACALMAADVNNDNVINEDDAEIILNIAVGLE